MAWKIVSGGLAAQPAPPQEPLGPTETGAAPQETESFGSMLQRNILSGAAKGVSAVQQLGSLPAQLVEAGTMGAIGLYESLTGQPTEAGQILRKAQQKSPSPERIQSLPEQQLEKLYGKEYLQPKNFGEKVFQSTISDLPMILMTGPSSLGAKLGTSLASNIGAKGAEEFGAGPLGQAAAGLASGLGFNLARSGALSPNKLLNSARKTMKASYKEAEKEAANLTVPAKALEDVLEKEMSQMLGASKKNLLSAPEKEAYNQIRRIDNQIQLGKISVEDAWNAKKRLNDLIKDAPDTLTRKRLSSIVGHLKEHVLDPAAESNPAFGNAYKTAEDLYKGLNAPSEARKLIEKTTDVKKLLTSKLGKAALLTNPVASGKALVAGSAVGGVARKGAQLFDFFNKSDVARDLYKDILDNAMSNNFTALTSNLKAFNKEAAQYEQENPLRSQSKAEAKSSSSGSWKVVKGGLLS